MRRLGLTSLISLPVIGLALIPSFLSTRAIAQDSAPKLVRSSNAAASTPSLQPANLPNIRTAPAGSEFYTAKRGDSIPLVARQNLKRTSYLTSAELADAIRHANGDRTGNILKNGEEIVIP